MARLMADLLRETKRAPSREQLAELFHLFRQEVARAEREAILTMARAWVGETVEGRELLQVIGMRERNQR